MTAPVAFVCLDCGAHVSSYGDVPGVSATRCAVCSWIAEIAPDPLERARLRAFATSSIYEVT